jgi:tryptophan halogenase
MKKTNIVILGGGTAGWLTALNFLQKTINTKITIVASEEIGIVGVGESTTAAMNALINLNNGFIKIDEKDFIEKTSATFKLGTLNRNWYSDNHFFTSPINEYFQNPTSFPSTDYDYYKIYHVANNIKYQEYRSLLMLNDKLPFLILDNNLQKESGYNNQFIDARNNSVGYHLDTYKTGKYLKEKICKHPRIEYKNSIIVDAYKNEKNIIEYLITKDNQKIYGDLFIDCSGMYRLLIQKKFNNNFISYKNNLIVNRAMPFTIKNNKIKNYTHVVAKKYGWCWEIPLQSRVGCGYVYNDNFITPDAAKNEIEIDLGFEIEPLNDIKFEPGRLQKFWIANVLSTGLASGFVEPLEATSIHMTILQINFFIEQFYTNNMNFIDTNMQDIYNSAIGSVWDDIRDFLTIHYISPRRDSDFWIEASAPERWSERILNNMQIWKYRMPRAIDYKTTVRENFYDLGNTLWYQILHGMHLLNPTVASKELEDFNLTTIAKNDYIIRQSLNQKSLSISIDNNDFYLQYLNKIDQFSKI